MTVGHTPHVKAPEVRYAKSGDVSIAYSVVGDGPFDIVFIAGWIISTLEYAWEGPPAAFFEQLARFSRLILLDKRGTGLSDRVTGAPDLETRMDDVRAVMDAVGSKRAAIIGVSEGGPMTLLFAATYPERTAAAVVFGSTSTYIKTEDHPWLTSNTEREANLARSQRANTWGTREWADQRLAHFAPDYHPDEAAREWWQRYLRLSSSPAAAAALARMNWDIDVRHVLPTIRVPVMVAHRSGELVFDIRGARYIAEHIPGGEFVELPGRNHAWFVEPDDIVSAVERFLTGIWDRGEWDAVETDRVLATVLFTDIVGSTEKLMAVGDAAWRDTVQKHHALVRRQIARFRGVEMDTAGDGFFARFDGPARAIRCACAIVEHVKELGIDVRAGLHTGECEILDGKVTGIAVHMGARVAGQAGPGEVLVSNTVRDLVSGSGLRFEALPPTELKGIPGTWSLFAVDPASA
jgi:class 3 adenylate cyclase/pimeloyl-ACP methyl ester carboxylesterase